MIRPVRPTDFKELMEIEARASPKSRYDLWEFTILYRRFPRNFLISFSDQIDGYIVFSPDGHIISMAVRPESRRRGIGSRLIKEVIASCVGKSLHLEVRASNVGAIKFYLKLGFHKRALVPGYYHDGEEALVMERPSSGNNEIEES